MAYRYRCGECGFKTSWGTESQGEQQQIAHYTNRHPGLAPGGQVETNTKNPGGGNGCFTFIVIAILLLFLASTCHR
jgi:hypothetical protein